MYVIHYKIMEIQQSFCWYEKIFTDLIPKIMLGVCLYNWLCEVQMRRAVQSYLGEMT